MSEGPSKAARNEIRKLKATYFNNIAVGFGLVGVVTPYFTSMYNDLGPKWLAKYPHDKIGLAVLIAVGSASLSYQLHKHARKILSKLED